MRKELSVSFKNVYLSVLPPLNIKEAHRQFYLQNDSKPKTSTKNKNLSHIENFLYFCTKIKVWYVSTHSIIYVNLPKIL